MLPIFAIAFQSICKKMKEQKRKTMAIRCNTPATRKFSKSNNGNKAKKIPTAKIFRDRIRIFLYICVLSIPVFRRFEYAKTTDTPTINRKNGNTKSVGVMPFHLACNRGAYTSDQEPGLFTTIISAMVNPRKASNESNL